MNHGEYRTWNPAHLQVRGCDGAGMWRARPRAGSAACLEPCPLRTLVSCGLPEPCLSCSLSLPQAPNLSPRRCFVHCSFYLTGTQMATLWPLNPLHEAPVSGVTTSLLSFSFFLVLQQVAVSSRMFSSSWWEAVFRDHVLGGVSALLCPCCWAFSADRIRTVFKIKYFMCSY